MLSIRVAFALPLFLTAPISATAQRLTHYYDFDGGGVTDDVGSVDGVLSGGARLERGALVLNGVDACVRMLGKLIPLNGAPFSVFIRFTADAQPQAIAEMISQGYSGGPGFYLGQVNGAWRVTDAYPWGETQASFPTGAHDVLLTSDGAGVRLVVDGMSVFTSPTPLNIADNGSGTNTIVGRQFDPYGEWFRGSIDVIKIFDGVVSYQQSTAARPGGGGETGTFRYDALGRLVETNVRRPSVRGYTATYRYDNAGNRTKVDVRRVP